MTTVVTGASGFLGSMLVQELVNRGRTVRAVVGANSMPVTDLDVETVSADVRDLTRMRTVLDGADSVFHLSAIIALAGNRLNLLTEINVKGSQNVARAALACGVQRYIHCSSIHAFDLKNQKAVIDETSARVGAHHALYDQTKAAGEALARNMVLEGLPAVVIHPSGVIGPGDHRPSRIGKFLIDLTARKIPALVTGGFDWVDVRDVCASSISAEESGRIGESYILSGEWHSARDLAAFGQEITGIPPPKVDIPLWLAKRIGPIGDAWGRLAHTEPRINSAALEALGATQTISHKKATDELGHMPRPTRESVHDAYRWFEGTRMIRCPLNDPRDIFCD